MVDRTVICQNDEKAARAWFLSRNPGYTIQIIEPASNQDRGSFHDYLYSQGILELGD